MEQTIDNVAKKPNLGRRKIEIKKIERKSSRQVAFTKRRIGLFRKASELCVLCGAKIAIFVTSQFGKLFTFGHPNVDSVIDLYQQKDERYNNGENHYNGGHYQLQPKVEDVELSEVMGKVEFLEAERDHLKVLNSKKGFVKEENSSDALGKNLFWWTKDTSNMELAELEQFRDSIEELRNNVKKRADEMAIIHNAQNFG